MSDVRPLASGGRLTEWRCRTGTAQAVCVTYWLNRLQHLPEHAPQLFCTLNPLHPPAKDKVRPPALARSAARRPAGTRARAG